MRNKKDTIKVNEETTDYIVAMVLNYYDDEETGERHYDLEGIQEELEDHIIGIIDTHSRKGIKINKSYLNMLEGQNLYPDIKKGTAKNENRL